MCLVARPLGEHTSNIIVTVEYWTIHTVIREVYRLPTAMPQVLNHIIKPYIEMICTHQTHTVILVSLYTVVVEHMTSAWILR